MAALCTGNYGLSQNSTDNSKEYFFVKLTDSAYRAVEEYQKNKNKHNNTHATIQILGNGGVISFPSSGGNVGQQFSFAIDEIEGSFECIQQQQNKLDVLGALPYKMRIHANDDVYETTRHRMAVAEELKNNKCTREIKPNQTDIGRKVKLKTAYTRQPNIPQKRDQILTTTTTQSPISSSNSSLNPVSSNNPLSIGSGIIQSPTAANVNALSSTISGTSSGLGVSSSMLSSSSPISAAAPLSASPSSSSLPSVTSAHNAITSSNNLNSNNPNSLNSITSNSNSVSKLSQNYSSPSTSLSTGASPASTLSIAFSSAAGSGSSGIGGSIAGGAIGNSYYNNCNNAGLRPTNGVAIGNNSSNNSRRGGSIGISNSNSNSNNSRNQRNGNRYPPDITKKKIRDRLIHLLALKPYKKPELYSRLTNEGIRDREKPLISGILKEISTMRDNTYNLKRQIWNDVNEEWPFYNEQDLQMLKRRKPQNLTPPLSSDGGSSTSGQSPTSTHNGSPPPAVKRPSLDRDRFYEEPTAKKQRISHFKKDTNEINRRASVTDSRASSNMNPRSRENHEIRSSSYYGSNTTPTKHHHEPEDNAISISYGVLGNDAARRISQREEMINGHSISHHQQNVISSHQQHSSSSVMSKNINNNNYNNNNTSTNHHHSQPNYHSGSNHHTSNNNNNNNSFGPSNNVGEKRRQGSSVSSSMTNTNITNAVTSIGSSPPGAERRTGGNMNINISNRTERNTMTLNDERSNTSNNNETSYHHNHHHHHHQSGGSTSSDIGSNSNGSGGSPATNTPHYDFSRFTPITSIDQRRLYKNEFESDYSEYRDLLKKIETVGRKFNMLAEQLESQKDNIEISKDIRRQILFEYERINQDKEHQQAKARFEYLHAKLAHIKSLVSEFDKTLSNGTAPMSSLSETMGLSSSGSGSGLNNNNNSNTSSSRNRISSLSPGGGRGGMHANNTNGTNSNSSSSNNKNSSASHLPPSPMRTSSSSSSSLLLSKQENY